MYKNMNITISIPNDVEVKLKDVTNKSGLITKLLNYYFNKDEDPNILKLKLNELTNNYNNKFDEMNYQIEIKEKQSEEDKRLKFEEEHKEERVNEAVELRMEEMKKNKHEVTFNNENTEE